MCERTEDREIYIALLALCASQAQPSSSQDVCGDTLFVCIGFMLH
jgi:hypothetical protein